MITDPISDMLTRIRNANSAMRDEVTMPSSKQKVALAEILKKEGYIADFQLVDGVASGTKVLKIQMKYSDDRRRTISGIKRVSTPGLRIYRRATDVPRVLGGLGVAVLS
ncbi:MAG: 30S ribosomal protein S8, partial [Actinobacteria bacterium]|nr:30S ribosomal protein S8 [Actinomycetota bacterium]